MKFKFYLFNCIFALSIFTCFRGNSQIISTICGTGVTTYNGDSILASAANINYPSCVVLDSAGNIYLTEFLGHRIRKIDAATNLISTIAGTGVNGYSGDFGPATNADLSSPHSITFDKAGNLYFSDRGNNVVRKISLDSGIITTIAGNAATSGNDGVNGVPATSVRLVLPEGLAFDANSNLYIAEAYGNCIRKVDAATGIISTIAGNSREGSYTGDGGTATLATLWFPEGLAFDQTGNLYIAEGFNGTIRKIDMSTNIISTIAGNGTNGYSGDGGPANLAILNVPTSVKFDSAGNMFIADYYEQRVRRIDALTNIITTVAGTGFKTSTTGGYSGDGGPATLARLNRPADVDVDKSGNLYIADAQNYRIRKVIGSTLPVNIISFEVLKHLEVVLVKWATASASNTDHYEVETLANSGDWKILGKVQAKNGAGVNNYSFFDANQLQGVRLYRLKQVDKDGKYFFSEIKRITMPGIKKKLIIYPNPVKNGVLTLELSTEVTSGLAYSIYDNSGKVVQTGKIVKPRQSIDVSKLSGAEYYLKIEEYEPVKFLK